MGDKPKNNAPIVEINKTATVPLAYHEMCEIRHHKKERNILITMAAVIVAIVISFVFLWLQYDYVTTTEVSGVYALVDSEGNVIASDLEPNDVVHIMELLNGDSETDIQP